MYIAHEVHNAKVVTIFCNVYLPTLGITSTKSPFRPWTCKVAWTETKKINI
jgi:hypothetical protein